MMSAGSQTDIPRALRRSRHLVWGANCNKWSRLAVVCGWVGVWCCRGMMVVSSTTSGPQDRQQGPPTACDRHYRHAWRAGPQSPAVLAGVFHCAGSGALLSLGAPPGLGLESEESQHGPASTSTSTRTHAQAHTSIHPSIAVTVAVAAAVVAGQPCIYLGVHDTACPPPRPG